MSGGRSWKSLYQANTENAIGLVRQCVNALTRGMKTDSALRDLADSLGTTHRRIRTLYHRDGTPVVLHHEWESLRYRSGLFFLNLAAHLRAKADEYETAGENLVADQMEFRWAMNAQQNTSNGVRSGAADDCSYLRMDRAAAPSVTRPSHTIGPYGRCARCGYPQWLASIRHPCTAAPVGDRPADTEAPVVDYFEIIRGIVG